jgi:hypothetical protein
MVVGWNKHSIVTCCCYIRGASVKFGWKSGLAGCKKSLEFRALNCSDCTWRAYPLDLYIILPSNSISLHFSSFSLNLVTFPSINHIQ